MGVNLDQLDDDLKIIERYVRERDREPGTITLGAFQRVALALPAMVAELVDHRSGCARLLPDRGAGWFVTCPVAGGVGRPCVLEWPSHDLLTPERIHVHLRADHQLSLEMTSTLLQSLRRSGRLPEVSTA